MQQEQHRQREHRPPMQERHHPGEQRRQQVEIWEERLVDLEALLQEEHPMQEH
jgi:anti-sigma-K factor RskA